jgi:cytochrome P450
MIPSSHPVQTASPASSPLRFGHRRRPPAPMPSRNKLGLLASYRALRRDGLSVLPADAYESAVDIQRGLLGGVALVSDPDAIRRVLLDNAANYRKDDLQLAKLEPALGRSLLTIEGANWKFQRRAVAPLFQPQTVVNYLPEMISAVTAMLERWDTAGGGPRDVAHEMTALTYDVISRTVFSGEIETSAEVMSAAVTRYFEILGRVDLWDIMNLPRWLWRPARWRVRPALRIFRGEVRRLLDRRRSDRDAGRRIPPDVVTLLLDARDSETGAALSDDVIHDNLVTFIGAGHETTANALTWTLFLLSEFPSEFDRLAAEVDAVAGRKAPTADEISRLTVVRMIAEESMRLYPPVPYISRQAVAGDMLGGKTITPNTRVVISPWIVHRHRTLWEEPDLFEPERFAPGRRPLIPRFAYLPFGAGPRICVGAAFAMQEIVVALAMIAQRFRPRLAEGAKIEPVARITLRPAHGMPMWLEPRNR